MTWLADLSPCTYFRAPPALKLSAVGWLSNEHPFSIGPVSRSGFAALKQLLEWPFSPWCYLGFHHCDLCGSSGYGPHGTRNLLVPGEHVVYACPELIVHYIADHGYAPPEEFCRALLRCPPIPSTRYFLRLLEIDDDAWGNLITGLIEPDPLIAERLRQLGREPIELPLDPALSIALGAVRIRRSERRT